MAVIGVDRLRGSSTAVLRPLPALAPGSSIVAGATLDDLGEPYLVLDPEGLVRAAWAGDNGSGTECRAGDPREAAA
jgi:two-component system chemotaxis sensor kinase CheA